MSYMEQIIFLDISAAFFDEIRKKFPNQIRLGNILVKITPVIGDVREVLLNNTAFVSPANSILDYGGGIDLIYSRMFPKLESDARAMIKHFECQKDGEYCLPVGSAMVVPVTNNNYVIASPTMVTPMNIKNTRNVYWCFLAVMYVIDKYNKAVPSHKQIKNLVVPGLGTGCGRVLWSDSVAQIHDAIRDFNFGRNYADGMVHESSIYLVDRNEQKAEN